MADTNTQQPEKPKGLIAKNKKVIYAIAIVAALLAAFLIFEIVEHGTLNIFSGDTKDAVSMNVSDTDIMLCGKCGEIKGSANCCNKNAATCDKCGMIKGSPGCCKITSDALLCSKCGEIKGSENCCNKDAVKCDKCGLIKGSPGCCKINNKN